MTDLPFPTGFLWGTATAAHQVEGQNQNNDWWRWEQTPGNIRGGDTSAVACNWWNGAHREDFALARGLGQNAHRLSVEWSRLQPRPGEWDASAVEYYRGVLKVLQDLGMTPMVTLQHFTIPLWLADMGGWENPRIASLFEQFVRGAARELGDLCRLWITLNEPNVLAHGSYVGGNWPPQVKNLKRGAGVMANMVRAHAAAYRALKEIQPEAQVGIAHHQRVFYPYNAKSPLDRLVAGVRDQYMNRSILDAIEEGELRIPLQAPVQIPEAAGTEDFLGINYYYSERTIFDLTRASDAYSRSVYRGETQPLLDLFEDAGDLDPAGLEQILIDQKRRNKPIYITENGIFESGPRLQSEYLVRHLAAVQRAIQAGADVRGYFWWSLVDNFEWNKGYTPRFGLFRLDVATQTRTPKPVAGVYAQIARANAIPDALWEEYGPRV